MINSDLIKKPFIIECLDLPQNIVVHTVYYNNDSLISVLLQIPGVDVKYRNNYMFGVNIAECFVMEKVIVEKIMKPQKVKYIGEGWAHLKNKVGYVTYQYFDSVWRKNHTYNFKPINDKFNTYSNVYIVKHDELEFPGPN